MRPIFSSVALGALLLAGATVSAFAQQAAEEAPTELAGTVWEWVGLTTADEQIDVDAPERYSMEVAEDGAVALQVDCNRGVSQLTFEGEDGIGFEPIAVTMMACPEESMAHEFTAALEAAESYRIEEGQLIFELADEAGTMHFLPAPE